MLYNLKGIKDAEVKNKTVFLRADLDVPLESSRIKDTSRLDAWFPTLESLVRNGAKVIIGGHLGRPKKQFSIFNSQFSISEPESSLLPVAKYIADKINVKIEETKISEFSGWTLAENISVLENLRFYREEEENNPEFAQRLASLVNIYVNDAFASSHRAHASITGITKHLPSFAGLRLLEEVKVLSGILENPKRPLAVIIGGAKIETKLPLVAKMHKFADFVLVGGEIVLKTEVLAREQSKSMEGHKAQLFLGKVNFEKTDTVKESIEEFLQIARKCKTIIWNGPLGLIEEEKSAKGTILFAQGLVEIDAYKLVGGGDTVGFLQKNNLLDKFSFVSTGGGAMLEFLSGEKLPGLTALEQK